MSGPGPQPAAPVIQTGARDLVRLHLPPPSLRTAVLVGVASAVTIAVLALLGSWSGTTWLAAGLGASCVLVFFAPGSPFSQPANVVGGHAVTTLAGLCVAVVAPTQWWSLGLAVGLGIGAMVLLRLTHPPAGGNPIIVLTAAQSWGYLVAPTILGAVVVVICGLVFHRLVRQQYPLAARL